MANDVKISVIVVFHNAELTIERTLQSLLSQTLDAVEYIFVDDGSTDRSLLVLRDFIALHPEFNGRHILVDYPVQRGSAYATGMGIAHAHGIYIMRVDADDYLEPDALSLLWQASAEGTFDVVMAPIAIEEPGRTRLLTFKSLPRDLNHMAINTLNFSMCNKLLRRRMLDDNNIEPYPGIDRWEDLGIVSRMMALSPSIAYCAESPYHYVVDPARASLSRSGSSALLHDHLLTALMLEEWFVDHKLQSQYQPFLNLLKFHSKVKLLRGKDKDVARWKQTFPEVNSRIMGMRQLGLHYRLLFTIVNILPISFTQWIADHTS